MNVVFEIVSYTIESALKAQEGGADRVELCDNPGAGGTTPSAGMLAQVRQHLTIDLVVMIRPRGGDFLYSIDEYHAMRKDIEMCKRASADGVVLGILKADGTLDKERCRKLIELARPMKVTCHRAFDMTRDPLEALEDCIEVGFDRILTSGQQAKAIQGTALLRDLVHQASGRTIIMPGSGIDENNAAEILSQTGASEIHFSAAAVRESNMRFRNNRLQGMGSEPGSNWSIRTVDPERIRTIRSIVRQLK